MKKLILILTFFLMFLNCNSVYAAKTVTKDYKITVQDKFSICATLSYPKVNKQNSFSTVVLLHSLGYNSEWWETLPEKLLDDGFAVLTIDLRGHGKSVYNHRLHRTSWKNLTNKAFVKYPDDVLFVIDYIKKENKRVFFDNWAMIGSDIGGSTAVLVANKIKYKPKTIVLISPVVKTHGLYIPVKLAELNNTDILSITGSNDIVGQNSDKYLKKFAQSTYAEYRSQSKANGMLMLKNDTELIKIIDTWITQYLK